MSVVVDGAGCGGCSGGWTDLVVNVVARGWNSMFQTIAAGFNRKFERRPIMAVRIRVVRRYDGTTQTTSPVLSALSWSRFDHIKLEILSLSTQTEMLVHFCLPLSYWVLSGVMVFVSYLTQMTISQLYSHDAINGNDRFKLFNTGGELRYRSY